MKKILLAILAVGTIATANAQQGTWLRFGNVGITNNTDADKNNNFDWNVNLGIGYQFNTNWTAGLNLGWAQNPNTKLNGSNDRSTTNMYEAGIFVRYSHPVNDLFFVFAQGDANYRGGYHTAGDNPADTKHTGFLIGVTPAVGMNIGCGAALTFSVGGLSYVTDKYDGAANANNTFAFTFGKTVNFGIQTNFSCHHMHGMHHHMDKDGDDDDASRGKHKKSKEKEGDDE
ncbi:MAG: porin family protein [Taibaiella sp.]|nr:porin family protein [Taibaiella sp.]